MIYCQPRIDHLGSLQVANSHYFSLLGSSNESTRVYQCLPVQLNNDITCKHVNVSCDICDICDTCDICDICDMCIDCHALPRFAGRKSPWSDEQAPPKPDRPKERSPQHHMFSSSKLQRHRGNSLELTSTVGLFTFDLCYFLDVFFEDC